MLSKLARLFFLFFLITGKSAFCQCPTSATTVIKESRCRENGSITINATPAGSYTYEITAGPEVTGISNSNVFTGLEAGNYSISIHGGGGCVYVLNATVPGNYQDPGLLVATTTDIYCPGGTGCLTAQQPTNGRTPYTYSIIAGPATRPVQPSPAFCGLAQGLYTLQALDSCGVVRTSQFTLGVDTGDFWGYTYNWNFEIANCNDLILTNDKYYYNTISHTLLKVWYVNPDGDTLKVNTLTTQREDRDTLVGMAKNYGTWQTLVFDDCGRMISNTFDYNETVDNNVYLYESSCDSTRAAIRNNWRFGVPNGVVVRRCSDNSIVYTNNQPPNNGDWWAGYLYLQYDSCYNIETYNGCGDTIRTSYAVPVPSLSFTGCGYPSCAQIGKADIKLYLNNPQNTVRPLTFTIISGASNVGQQIVSVNEWEQYFGYQGLTPGMYQIELKDPCGLKDTILIDATKGLYRNIEVTQTPHCSGGANIHVRLTSNQLDCDYPSGGEWQTMYIRSTTPSYTPYNVSLTGVTATTNGVWEGDFLDVRDDSLMLSTWVNPIGCGFDTTIKVNKYIAPTLANVKGYVCAGTGIGVVNYNVNNGLAPFRFRIKPDASSTWGPWQDSAAFSSIAPGSYDVNVEDACPNGSIRSLVFSEWARSDINFGSACVYTGDPVTLSADPRIALVNYQWYKDNVYVGSGPSYIIPSFSTAYQGQYTLKQTFRGGTCADSTKKWLLQCSILSMLFGELSGVNDNKTALLKWDVLRDVPGSVFTIERSTNPPVFITIGTVNGSSGSTDYSFRDNNLPAATASYRIKYTSPNGKSGYSNIIRIGRNDVVDKPVTVRPVPFKYWLALEVKSNAEGKCNINLYDLGGKPVFKKTETVKKGNNNFWLDGDRIASLPGGTYIIEVATDDFTKRLKVIKQ